VSVDNNIRYIQALERIYPDNPGIPRGVWIDLVREGGAWDYKLLTPDLRYEAFGNFNYGATGRVLFGSETLQRAAGAVQYLTGPRNSAWGVPWGAAPFGDQPIDNFWIRQGAQYYESNLFGP
jgi:hypothetical protein